MGRLPGVRDVSVGGSWGWLCLRRDGREESHGDGTVLYPNCGGGYMQLHI